METLFGRPVSEDRDVSDESTQALRQLLPARTLAALDRYFGDHRPAGHFVMAVLRNDLQAACALADEENVAALVAIVRYLYNCAPGGTWGSPSRVERWLERGRLAREGSHCSEG